MLAVGLISAGVAVVVVCAFVYGAYWQGRRNVDAECVQLRVTTLELMKRIERKRLRISEVRDLVAQLVQHELDDPVNDIVTRIENSLQDLSQRLGDEDRIERHKLETDRFFRVR